MENQTRGTEFLTMHIIHNEWVVSQRIGEHNLKYECECVGFQLVDKKYRCLENLLAGKKASAPRHNFDASTTDMFDRGVLAIILGGSPSHDLETMQPIQDIRRILKDVT